MFYKKVQIILIICVSTIILGCSQSDSSKSSNNDSTTQELTQGTLGDESGEIAEDLKEYMEWVDNSRINLDVNDYYYLETNLQYVLALSKDAYEKSFEGEYVLKVTSKGTVLLFDEKNVDDNDVLWVELSSAFPEWKEIVKRTNIPDAILTIKDGKVIRTLNPADYLNNGNQAS